ncbi:MAG: lysophospholipid acyltransferase family protein [Actinomycetes bacterium]
MAELVYPPIIFIVKSLWKYLRLELNFQGEAHVPRKGAAIFAMNHIGYLDFAIVGTAVLPANRLVRFMAKKEIFDHKITGPLMRGMKHISVDRTNGSSSFVAALRALKAGELVGIFPEATISRSFELKEMKTGAVRLAMASGAPILPTIVWGSQRIWTKNVKRDFSRSSFPVTVAIGEPIFVARDADVEAKELELKNRLTEMLAKVQAEYPDSYLGQRWAPARLGGTAPTLAQIAEEKKG